MTPTALEAPSWVAPFSRAVGMDHLGIQVLSEQMYGTLLPGITNLTDRIWNFAFYPWFTWACQEQGLALDGDSYARLLRRAEVLATLVAAVHELEDGDGRGAERHGGGLVGREKLRPAASELLAGGMLDLTEFADQDAPRRYFANWRGGMGMYYLGSLRMLGIMDWHPESGGKVTLERGKVLAKAMDSGVPRQAFFNVLAQGNLDLATARSLSPFCPCSLGRNRVLRSQLEGLLTCGRTTAFADMEGGLRRRQSLQLILTGAAHFPNTLGRPFDPQAFRESIYCNRWMNGDPVGVPEALQQVQEGWRQYQRHDLFSIALQGLFWAGLFMLAKGEGSVESPAEYGDWFLSSFEPFLTDIAPLKTPLTEVLQTWRAGLPRLEEVSGNHENFLARMADTHAGRGAAGESVKASVGTLLSLLARGVPEQPYSSFGFDVDHFQGMPINLMTFAATANTDGTFGAWLRRIALEFGIEAHFRVAFRKLHRQGYDTFKLRPGEDRYWALGPADIPPPSWTTPRLGPAIRMLIDVGFLDPDRTLTRLGADFLAEDGFHG